MLAKGRIAVAVGLLVLLGACGDAGGAARAPRPVTRAVRPQPGQGMPAVEAVHPSTTPQGAGRRDGRDPFQFAGDGEGPHGTEGSRFPGRAAPLPELPLPLAEPALRLLGIAGTSDAPPVRTAILEVGRDLVLARVGDQIGGRYTVVGIGVDSVDLQDAVGSRPIHLAWR